MNFEISYWWHKENEYKLSGHKVIFWFDEAFMGVICFNSWGYFETIDYYTIIYWNAISEKDMEITNNNDKIKD